MKILTILPNLSLKLQLALATLLVQEYHRQILKEFHHIIKLMIIRVVNLNNLVPSHLGLFKSIKRDKNQNQNNFRSALRILIKLMIIIKGV